MTDPLISGAVLFSHNVRDSLNVFGVIIEPALDNVNNSDAIQAFKGGIWSVWFWLMYF